MAKIEKINTILDDGGVVEKLNKYKPVVENAIVQNEVSQNPTIGSNLGGLKPVVAQPVLQDSVVSFDVPLLKPKNPLAGVGEPQAVETQPEGQIIQPQVKPLQNEPYGLPQENVTQQQLDAQLGKIPTQAPSAVKQPTPEKPKTINLYGAKIEMGREQKPTEPGKVGYYGAQIEAQAIKMGKDDFSYGMEVYGNSIKQWADIPHQILAYTAMLGSKITDANQIPLIGGLAKSLGVDLNKVSDAFIEKIGSDVVKFDIFEDRRQKIEAKYKNLDVSDYGRLSTDVLNGALDMVPQVTLAWTTGGANSLLFMFVRTASRSTEQAIEEMEANRYYNEEFKNLTDKQITDRALAFGTISGAIEVGTEMIMGGFGGAPKSAFSKGLGDFAEDLVQKVVKEYVSGSELAEKAIKYGFRFIGEGFEEYLSEVLGNYANLLYKKGGVETDLGKVLTSKEAGYAFLTGTLTSVVMDSVNIGAVKVIDSYAYEQAQRIEQMQPEERLDYARKLLARSGTKIIVADTYDVVDKNGVMQTIDVASLAEGAYDEKNKTIIIPNDVYQNKNLITVSLMHEFTHTLEQSGMYQSFRKSVIDYLKNNGTYDAMYELKKQEYGRIDENTDIDSEIVASFVQDTFFKRIIKTKDGFKRVADFSALNGVLRSMGKEKALSMKNIFRTFVYRNYEEDMQSQSNKLNDMISEYNGLLEEIKEAESIEQYMDLAEQLQTMQATITEMQSTIGAFYNNHYLASLESSFSAMVNMVEKQLDSMEVEQNMEMQRQALEGIVKEEEPTTVTKNGIKFQIALGNTFEDYRKPDFASMTFVLHNGDLNIRVIDTKIGEIVMNRKILETKKVLGLSDESVEKLYQFVKGKKYSPSEYASKGDWVNLEKESEQFKGVFTNIKGNGNLARLIVDSAVSIWNAQKNYAELEKFLSENKDALTGSKTVNLLKFMELYEAGNRSLLEATYGFEIAELLEEYTELLELARKNIDISKYESGKELIAVHGVNYLNLIKSLKVGGFVSPSIAVTSVDDPLINFGDTILIMNPSVLEGSRTFGVDAYTPRFPDEYVIPKDVNKLNAFLDKIGKESGANESEVSEMKTRFNGILMAKTSKSMGNFEGFFKESPFISKYYKNNGFTDAEIDEELFLSDIIKNGGMRAIHFNGEYQEANLENYVKHMNQFAEIVGDKGIIGRESQNYFNSEHFNLEMAKAYQTPVMKSVEEVASYKPFIGRVSQSLYDLYDADDKFENTILSLTFEQNTSNNFNGKIKNFLIEKGSDFTQKELEEYLIDSGVTNTKNLRSSNDFYASLDNGQALYRMLTKIRDSIELYIESKPARVVYFNEIALALLPNILENNQELKDLLDASGIKYEFVGHLRANKAQIIKDRADKLGYVKFMLKQDSDSEGNKLSMAQKEFFKGSKATEGGKLKAYSVITPEGEKKGYYNTKVPLDTRQGESFQFMNDFSAKTGIVVAEDSLPDRKTAIKIMDFVTQQGYMYDAVAYQENGQSGYITLNSNQFQFAEQKQPKQSFGLQYMIREMVAKGYDFEYFRFKEDYIKDIKGIFDSVENKQDAMDYLFDQLWGFQEDTIAMYKAKNVVGVLKDEELNDKISAIEKEWQIFTDVIVNYFEHYDKNLPSDSHGYNLSPQQQEYFAKSVVRDAFGNLLRVFHGRRDIFDFFDTTKSNRAMYGRGTYFSQRSYVSMAYTDEQKLIDEYYLDIRNPIRPGDSRLNDTHITKILIEFQLNYQDEIRSEIKNPSVIRMVDEVIRKLTRDVAFGKRYIDRYIFPSGVSGMQDLWIIDNLIGSMDNLASELDPFYTETDYVKNEYKKMTDAIRKKWKEKELTIEGESFSIEAQEEIEEIDKEMRLAYTILVETMYRGVRKITGYDGYMGEHFVTWLPEQVKVYDNRKPTTARYFDERKDRYVPSEIRFMVRSEKELGEDVMKIAKEFKKWVAFETRISKLDDETLRVKYPTLINEDGILDYDLVRSAWEMARLKDMDGIRLIEEEGFKTNNSVRIIRNSSIYQDLVRWTKEARSDNKPKIFETIVGNPSLRSAMLTIMYQNYRYNLVPKYLRSDIEEISKNPEAYRELTFEEYINTPVTLYRGQFSNKKLIVLDRVVSYTPRKEIAQNFTTMHNGLIDSISIKPILTFGSFTALYGEKYEFEYAEEQEVFVPRSVVREKSKNLKYQIKDSKGRVLTPEQSEFFKGVSRHLKDKNGNIIPLYHGSDYSGFTVPANYLARKEFNTGTMYLSNDFDHASTYVRFHPQQYELMQIDGRERLIATGYTPKRFDASKVKKNVFTEMESVQNMTDLEQLGKDFVEETGKNENKFYKNREITVSVANEYLSETGGVFKWFDNYHPIMIDGKEFTDFEHVPLSKISQVYAELQRISKEMEGDRHVAKSLSFNFNGKMAYHDEKGIRILNNYTIKPTGSVLFRNKKVKIEDIIHDIKMAGFFKYLNLGDIYEGYANIRRPIVIPSNGMKWNRIRLRNAVVENDENPENFKAFYNFAKDKKSEFTTNDIVIMATELKNRGVIDSDAVIFLGVIDNGGGWSTRNFRDTPANDYVLLEEGMFKDASNKNPTNDPNIKFMVKEQFSVYKNKMDILETNRQDFEEYRKVMELTVENFKSSKTARRIVHEEYGGNFALSIAQKIDVIEKAKNHKFVSQEIGQEGYLYKAFRRYMDATDYLNGMDDHIEQINEIINDINEYFPQANVSARPSGMAISVYLDNIPTDLYYDVLRSIKKFNKSFIVNEIVNKQMLDTLGQKTFQLRIGYHNYIPNEALQTGNWENVENSLKEANLYAPNLKKPYAEMNVVLNKIPSHTAMKYMLSEETQRKLSMNRIISIEVKKFSDKLFVVNEINETSSYSDENKRVMTRKQLEQLYGKENADIIDRKSKTNELKIFNREDLVIDSKIELSDKENTAVNEMIKSVYAPKDSIRYAGFILNDGSMIEIEGYHSDVANMVGMKLEEFISLGHIRIREDGIQFGLKEPSDEQYESLMEAVLGNEEYYATGLKFIFIDMVDYSKKDQMKGAEVKSAKYDLRTGVDSLVDMVKDFYKNGDFWEETKIDGSYLRYSLKSGYQKAKERFSVDKDGTYDFFTGKEISYPDGLQFSFEQEGVFYSEEVFDKKTNEIIKRTGSKLHLGHYGTKEVSFRTKILGLAIKIAQQYDQKSVWDFGAKNGEGAEIKQFNYKKTLEAFSKERPETYSYWRELRDKTIVPEVDDTYDFETKEPVVFNSGYQFSFERPKDDYTGWEFDSIVENMVEITGNKAYLGRFGNREVSFHTDNLELAIEMAMRYDQDAVWDFANQTVIEKKDYKKILKEIEKSKEEMTGKSSAQAKQDTDDDIEMKTRKHPITTANSGNVSAKIIKTIEQEIDDGELDYIPASDAQAIKHANAKIGSNPNKAFNEFKALYDSGKRIKKNDIAVAETLIQIYSAKRNTKKAMELITMVAELATELGQSVQALSLIKRTSPQGRRVAIEKAIGRLKAKYFEMGKTLDIKINQSLMDELLTKTTTEDMDAVVDKIKQDIADQMPSTLFDKLNAWRYLSMLGNPRTHIRNLVGNGTFWAMNKMKDTVATGIERVFIEEGKRTKSVFVSKEIRTFAEQLFEDVKDEITSSGKYDIGHDIESLKKVFEPEWLESLRKFNFDMLEKEDTIFMRWAFIESLGQYMQARNIDPKTVTPKQIEMAKLHAIKEAKKRTFRQASELANTLNHIEKTNKIASFFIASTIPFKKTPINIMKSGFEFSPAGLLVNSIKGAVDVKRGKITATQFVDQISAGLTGTSIALLGAWLYSMGLISGGEDDEETAKLRAYNRQLGAQPYSLNLFGTNVSLDWVTPAVMPFIIGAEIEKVVEKGLSGSLVNEAPEALISIFDPAFELTMLQGITSTLQSYSDSGAGVASEVISQATANYITQFAPTLLAQIGRITDQTVRTTYAPSDSQYNQFAESTIRKILGKFPLTNTLNQPSINIKGEVTKGDDNILVRALQNLLNPANIKQSIADPTDEEIRRLYSITGKSSLIPALAPKSFSYEGNNYILSGTELTAFGKTLGQKSYEVINSLINSSVYKSLPDSLKADAVSDALDYASALAKSEMLTGRGVDYNESILAKVEEAKSAGIATNEYLLMKSKFDTIKASEDNTKKQNTIMYLIQSGKSDEQIERYLVYIGGYEFLDTDKKFIALLRRFR